MDYQLSANSAGLDEATASDAPSIDLRDNPRPVDIEGMGFDGSGMGFDIGAFEWQPPTLSVPFSTLYVGELFIGARSDFFLPITNSGGDPLEFQSFGLSFIGPNSDDFHFEPDPPDKSAIMPGETRFILFYFSPEDTGTRTAVLTIETSDPNNPQTGIILNGIGLEPLDSWIIR